MWGKILTVDMLMKRGCPLVNRCFLCKNSEESADHILIHCNKTRQLWFGMGVPGFSEKSSPIMEIQGL